MGFLLLASFSSFYSSCFSSLIAQPIFVPEPFEILAFLFTSIREVYFALKES
jgi:hypothetical protein